MAGLWKPWHGQKLHLQQEKLYNIIYEWIKLIRANQTVKIAIDFKMDVMFAQNLNLSLGKLINKWKQHVLSVRH